MSIEPSGIEPSWGHSPLPACLLASLPPFLLWAYGGGLSAVLAYQQALRVLQAKAGRSFCLKGQTSSSKSGASEDPHPSVLKSEIKISKINCVGTEDVAQSIELEFLPGTHKSLASRPRIT